MPKSRNERSLARGLARKRYRSKPVKIWAVMHDNERNIWQALVVGAESKLILFRGPLMVGIKRAYIGLTSMLDDEMKRDDAWEKELRK